MGRAAHHLQLIINPVVKHHLCHESDHRLKSQSLSEASSHLAPRRKRVQVYFCDVPEKLRVAKR